MITARSRANFNESEAVCVIEASQRTRDGIQDHRVTDANLSTAYSTLRFCGLLDRAVVHVDLRGDVPDYESEPENEDDDVNHGVDHDEVTSFSNAQLRANRKDRGGPKDTKTRWIGLLENLWEQVEQGATLAPVQSAAMSRFIKGLTQRQWQDEMTFMFGTPFSAFRNDLHEAVHFGQLSPRKLAACASASRSSCTAISTVPQ